MLGMAKLTLSSVSVPIRSVKYIFWCYCWQDCPELIQHRIPLIPEKDDSSEDVSLGHITVSLVFRPVASVGQANSECHVTPLALSGQGEDGTSRRVSLEKEEKSKVFKKRCQDYQLGGKHLATTLPVASIPLFPSFRSHDPWSHGVPGYTWTSSSPTGL